MKMKIKTWQKATASAVCIAVVMLALPLLILNLADSKSAMGFMMILFFAVDPLAVILISIMAGTDINRLWWIPPVSAIAFSLCMWLVLQELVWEMLIYSVLYVCIGCVAMLGTHFAMDFSKKRTVTGDNDGADEPRE